MLYKCLLLLTPLSYSVYLDTLTELENPSLGLNQKPKCHKNHKIEKPLSCYSLFPRIYNSSSQYT